jgi:hypothetical protein
MCDCEMPEVFTLTKRKAKKRHRCCECRGWIEIGEKYEYTSGIWDGEPSDYKTCLGCAELRDELSKISQCCIPLTGLREELMNYSDYNDDQESRVAPLLGRFEAIRIQRGVTICPVYQQEESGTDL